MQSCAASPSSKRTATAASCQQTSSGRATSASVPVPCTLRLWLLRFCLFTLPLHNRDSVHLPQLTHPPSRRIFSSRILSLSHLILHCHRNKVRIASASAGNRQVTRVMLHWIPVLNFNFRWLLTPRSPLCALSQRFCRHWRGSKSWMLQVTCEAMLWLGCDSFCCMTRHTSHVTRHTSHVTRHMHRRETSSGVFGPPRPTVRTLKPETCSKYIPRLTTSDGV